MRVLVNATNYMYAFKDVLIGDVFLHKSSYHLKIADGCINLENVKKRVDIPDNAMVYPYEADLILTPRSYTGKSSEQKVIEQC